MGINASIACRKLGCIVTVCVDCSPFTPRAATAESRGIIDEFLLVKFAMKIAGCLPKKNQQLMPNPHTSTNVKEKNKTKQQKKTTYEKPGNVAIKIIFLF